MAFMIGPVFFVLIQTSILKGARAAIVFDLGVLLGDVSFILIAYYGSRSLLEKIKDDPDSSSLEVWFWLFMDSLRI